MGFGVMMVIMGVRTHNDRVHIPEVTKPGITVMGLPDEVAWDAYMLIGHMETALGDAAIALQLFIDAERAWIEAFKLGRGRFREETGWPYDYVRRLEWIHARTFLYALDQIGASLYVLVRESKTVEGHEERAEKLADLWSRWQAAMPHVRQVRNTSHHGEDRLRWRGKDGETINAPAIRKPGREPVD
jgi:hypothetical protein